MCGCNKNFDGIDTDILYDLPLRFISRLRRILNMPRVGVYDDNMKDRLKQRAKEEKMLLRSYIIQSLRDSEDVEPYLVRIEQSSGTGQPNVRKITYGHGNNTKSKTTYFGDGGETEEEEEESTTESTAESASTTPPEKKKTKGVRSTAAGVDFSARDTSKSKEKEKDSIIQYIPEYKQLSALVSVKDEDGKPTGELDLTALNTNLTSVLEGTSTDMSSSKPFTREKWGQRDTKFESSQTAFTAKKGAKLRPSIITKTQSKQSGGAMGNIGKGYIGYLADKPSFQKHIEYKVPVHAQWIQMRDRLNKEGGKFQEGGTTLINKPKPEQGLGTMLYAKKGGKVSKEDMPCNKPRSSWRTDKKYVVKCCAKDSEKIVHFGDPNAEDFKKHKDKDRRDNFKARHNCSDKNDKCTPGWWSCNWSW